MINQIKTSAMSIVTFNTNWHRKNWQNKKETTDEKIKNNIAQMKHKNKSRLNIIMFISFFTFIFGLLTVQGILNNSTGESWFDSLLLVFSAFFFFLVSLLSVYIAIEKKTKQMEKYYRGVYPFLMPHNIVRVLMSVVISIAWIIAIGILVVNTMIGVAGFELIFEVRSTYTILIAVMIIHLLFFIFSSHKLRSFEDF